MRPFYPVLGMADPGSTSYQSFNYATNYLKHNPDGILWIGTVTSPQDNVTATFKPAPF